MRPGRLLLLTVVAALVVNGVSVTLRLIAVPLQRAQSERGALTLDEPFTGFSLLLGQFNTDGEANLAVWFSSVLLLLTALTSTGVWLTQRRQRTPWRGHWLALGLLFSYVSLDEVAVLHELAIPLMAQVVEARGVLTFAWVVLGAPIVVVLALSFLPFLWKLAHRTGLLLAVAGLVFVSGALGLELLGGWVLDTGGSPFTTQYVWATTVEELLENVGAALALYAVTRHATRTLPPLPNWPAPVDAGTPTGQASEGQASEGQASGGHARAQQFAEHPARAR